MKPVTRLTVFGIRLAVVLVAVYWTVIAVGTHVPARLEVTAGYSDKWRHFVAFFGLTIGLAWVTSSPKSLIRTSRRFAIIAAVVMGYAVLDEATQAFIPGRTPDRYDVVADGVGMVAGIVVFLSGRVGYRWIRKRRPVSRRRTPGRRGTTGGSGGLTARAVRLIRSFDRREGSMGYAGRFASRGVGGHVEN